MPAPPSRRCSRLAIERADDARRESQHQQQDDAAEQGAPEFGLAHDACPAGRVKAVAPTIGPVRVWMPPSSTMTRPSIERPTWIVSGEIEPLAKANSPPAMPQIAAGNGEAEPVHALDVDADRLGAQRRVAAGPHRIAERREQEAAQQQHADDGEAPGSAGNTRQALLNGGGGQTPTTPFEPPVKPSHWNTIAQTICAKASVSIAR